MSKEETLKVGVEYYLDVTEVDTGIYMGYNEKEEAHEFERVVGNYYDSWENGLIPFMTANDCTRVKKIKL